MYDKTIIRIVWVKDYTPDWVNTGARTFIGKNVDSKKRFLYEETSLLALPHSFGEYTGELGNLEFVPRFPEYRYGFRNTGDLIHCYSSLLPNNIEGLNKCLTPESIAINMENREYKKQIHFLCKK